jgi:hypothetical protein
MASVFPSDLKPHYQQSKPYETAPQSLGRIYTTVTGWVREHTTMIGGNIDCGPVKLDYEYDLTKPEGKRSKLKKQVTISGKKWEDTECEISIKQELEW